MIGLGIETSCDETSIGIVESGTKLLSLKIYSQVETHSEYRGVVPEIASRAHLEKINLILEQAMLEANIQFDDLNYIAVTTRPGLIGSLMIGAQLARCISLVYKIPIIAVDHLEAHLSVIYLEEQTPIFPSLGLLLSGGNSSIFILKDFGKLELIADTIDDALGEAFDKVGAMLDLPYPGGPNIEKQANLYTENGEKNPFPELLKDLNSKEIKFSYSGLKTSVLYYTKKFDKNIPKICYFFQKTAFQLVEKNISRAVKKTGIKRVIASGGVLANTTLRNHLENIAEKLKIKMIYPQKKILCTDNGAMVACLGYYLHQKKEWSNLDFKISPSRF